jgi:hypothetical protein
VSAAASATATAAADAAASASLDAAPDAAWPQPGSFVALVYESLVIDGSDAMAWTHLAALTTSLDGRPAPA